MTARFRGGPARVFVGGEESEGVASVDLTIESVLADAPEWVPYTPPEGRLTRYGRRWVRNVLRSRRPRLAPWKAAHARRYPRRAR